MAFNQRNAILLGIAIVALAVAAYIFFTRGARESYLPDRYTIDGVCLKCKQQGEFTYSAKQDMPLKCPHCGERAVYEWMYCYDCKHRLIPALVQREGRAPSYPMIPTCPKCGSQHVGGYIAVDPDQQPVGDLELPEMP